MSTMRHTSAYSYEEEDTWCSYEEEDTWCSYEEEDTWFSYEEEDTWCSYEEEDTWCSSLMHHVVTQAPTHPAATSSWFSQLVSPILALMIHLRAGGTLMCGPRTWAAFILLYAAVCVSGPFDLSS
jgi:hypothetical protein